MILHEYRLIEIERLLRRHARVDEAFGGAVDVLEFERRGRRDLLLLLLQSSLSPVSRSTLLL